MYAVVSPSPPSLYRECYKRGLSRKAINYILQQYDTRFNICTCCFNIWGGGRWSILLTIAFCDGGRGSSSFLGFVMSFPFLQHIYKSTGENTNLTKQAGTAERNFKLGRRGKVKTSKSIEGEGTPRRWSNWPVKLVYQISRKSTGVSERPSAFWRENSLVAAVIVIFWLQV